MKYTQIYETRNNHTFLFGFNVLEFDYRVSLGFT